jgi:hypothetical protein
MDSGAEIQSMKGLDQYMRLPFPLMNGRVLKYAIVVGGKRLESLSKH